MSWFSRLIGGGKSDHSPKPQRLDYLNEALALERQGDFDAALTSYRLAMRDHPNDPRILQNMAIAFSRTGRMNEAIGAYRRALELDSTLADAPGRRRASCQYCAILMQIVVRNMPVQAASGGGI